MKSRTLKNFKEIFGAIQILRFEGFKRVMKEVSEQKVERGVQNKSNPDGFEKKIKLKVNKKMKKREINEVKK